MDLMDRLEKTASGSFVGGAREYIDDLSGRKARHFRDALRDKKIEFLDVGNQQIRDIRSNGGPSSYSEDYRKQLNREISDLEGKLLNAESDKNDARLNTGFGLAGLGVSGWGVHELNKIKEYQNNKTASAEGGSDMDLFERLEKTAYESNPAREGYITDKTTDAAIAGGLAGAGFGSMVGNLKGAMNMHEPIAKSVSYEGARPHVNAMLEGAKHQLGYAGRGARTGALIGGLGLGAIAANSAAEKHMAAREEEESKRSLEQHWKALEENDAINRSVGAQQELGEEQLAHEELMNSLEKTANETHQEKRDFTKGEELAGLGMILGGAGAGYGAGELVKRRDLLEQRKKDLAEAGSYSKLTATKWTPATGEWEDASPEYRRKLLEGMGKRTDKAVKAMDHKKHKMALAGGLLGVGASSVYGLTRDRDIPQEQLASGDLLESLEKTARLNIAGSIKGFANSAKQTGKDALGINYNKAKKALDKENTIEAVQKNFELGKGIATQRQNLEALDAAKNAAKADMKSAQKKVALGAAAVGAGAAGGATGATVADRRKEKLASEEFMTGIYKEAAAQILDMHIPETKAYVDPMSKISFSK